MTRKLLAVIAMVALAAGACTRSASGGGGATPGQVYAATPTESDIRNLLGSSDWWQTTPSFGVRPLGLPSMPQTLNFSITNRFIHVGTSELFTSLYYVFTTTSAATTAMTNISTNNPGAPTTPHVGDQVIYAGQKLPNKAALYSTVAYIRVGQVIITVEWDRDQGFADLSQMGRIGAALVTKLKNITSGKVKPSPVPHANAALLPPPGTDVTLVGVASLPIEAAVADLGLSSPQAAVDAFQAAGVKDFLFGDYALNADLSMEVRAFVFTFGSPAGATAWITGFAGSASLDANGVASGYASAAGFYYAFFAGGSHGAMLFCNALDMLEAAARACEAPFGRLINSWVTSLNGGALPTPAASPSPRTTPTAA